MVPGTFLALIEGGARLYTKKQNLHCGVLLMRAMAECYAATRGEMARRAAASREGRGEVAE